MRRRFGFLLLFSLLSAAFGGVFAHGQSGDHDKDHPPLFPELKPHTESVPVQQEEDEEDAAFPRKREEWFTLQRSYPFAHIPAGGRTKALQQHLALKRLPAHSVFASPGRNALSGARSANSSAATAKDSFASLLWSPDGPTAISAGGPSSVPYSGRATSLVIDPSQPSTMYLGTAAGGVWKTSDAGQTWKPVTDFQASLAIGALAIDPNNTQTIYAGTGEADYSGDSYYGQGLLKSTDGGATWTLISAPFVSGGSAAPFAQIAIQPGNSSVVVAATESGIYRSTDAGATWVNTLPSYASAVIFDPAHTNVAYAGMNGYFNSIVYGNVTAAIYKSTDSGATWTALTGASSNPLPAGKTVVRVALTLDSSGNLLAGIGPSTYGSGTPYKSTDAGATWTALTSPNDGLDWYRDWIVSVPGSPNTLYAGGVNLYQSLDGGVTWTKSTESYAALLWADQHAAVFSPDGSKMYLLDDGGLFVTSSPTSTNPAFTSLNNGIGSMTFYPGFAITGSSSGGTVAGSQDHGTQLGTGAPAWGYAGGGNVCGDGGPVTVDIAGLYAYAHCQGSPLSSWMSSATGGAPSNVGFFGWVSAQAGITLADRTAWIPPISTDPSNAANVYTGTYRVYQSTNRAAMWTAISGDLTAGSSTLSTIAVAPSNANVIYTGSYDGTVSVSKNALMGATSTWSRLSGLPNRSITKLLVAPDSPQDVYATVSGFGTGHIFHSTDGGITWADLSGNLPDTPANSVAVDPSLLQTLYLATDTGVYVSSNLGSSWEILGANLPNVVVQDVQIVAASRLLRIVTHGRGAWDLILPANGFISSTNLVGFGDQAVNSSSAVQAITLSNNFEAAVAISGITTSANFSETNNCGTSLASGAKCSINVVFSPTAPSAYDGTLSISSSQGNLSVTLTGNGIGVPDAVLSASAITFLGQPLGVASASQTINLMNSGSASLTGVALTLTGANAADFAETTTCGVTLAAGSSCAVSLSFTPGGVGNRSATLNVADNASGSPQTIAITGIGTAPFSISTASPSTSVVQGSNAVYQLMFAAAPGATLGAVTLSCSGLPSETSCSFSPTMVPGGTASQTIALTVSTTAATASVRSAPLFKVGGGVLFCGALLTFFGLPRRRRHLVSVLLLMASAVFVTACGNGGGSPPATGNPGTPAATYTISVTAQSSSYSAVQALTLVVTP